MNTIKLDPEAMESAMRHFRKVVLEGKHPNNNLQMIDIASIIARNKSLRKHSQKQLQKLINAIKKFGFTNPILIDKKLKIIAGELRLLAAKKLGFCQIPVIILEDLTDEEVEAIRILDNRIAEDSEWNYANLQEAIENLGKFDISFEDLGFETVDYDKIFLNNDSEESEVKNSEQETADWLDANIPKRANLWDLWRLGDNFILCANSLLQKAFEILMQGELAQIVITDPPYNCKVNGHVCGLGKIKHNEFAMASGEMTEAEFAEFISGFMQHLVKFSSDGSLHYIFMDWRNINILLNQGKKHYTELKDIAIWDKTQGGMGLMYRSQHEMIPIFKNGKAKHQFIREATITNENGTREKIPFIQLFAQKIVQDAIKNDGPSRKMLLQNLNLLNFDFWQMIENKAFEDFEPETSEEDEKFYKDTLRKILEDYYRNNPENL